MLAQEAQARRDLRLGARGSVLVDVGLVDDHQVGNLHHALLDGLQIVARIGQLHQHKHVRHARHRNLALAHAHGLDDDHVVACGLADQHGLARLLGHAAQRAAAGAGADVGAFVDGEVLHARLVAQDGAARDGAGRVDGEHRHAVAQSDEIQAQRLDKGGLAHAGHAADAQTKRFAGVGQQRCEQFVALRAVIGAGRFEQRDGFGHGAALHGSIAMQHALQQRAWVHATALRICSSTSLALAGMGVPGP